MARRFKKNPSFNMVSLPGYGALYGDTVIEGDQYAKFCPALLTEVFEAPAPPPPPPAPPPVPPSPPVVKAEPPAAKVTPEAARTKAATQTPAVKEQGDEALDEEKKEEGLPEGRKPRSDSNKKK